MRQNLRTRRRHGGGRRSQPRRAQRVIGEIRQSGGVAEVFEANIGKPEKIEAMIQFAIDRFGRLDVLHNNAIFSVMGRDTDIDLKGWQLTMDVSLTAYWYAAKVAMIWRCSSRARG